MPPRTPTGRAAFGALLSRAYRQWRRAADLRLQPYDLTEATWLPLIYVALSRTPMRQKDLAAALALDGSSVVRLLDALEAFGHIERRDEDGDRRAKTITLTTRGWSIIEQVETVLREVRRATMHGLTDDDLAVATRVLDLVCQNLARQQDQDE